MKKILLFLVIIAILSVCACQPTPEKSAVQSKGNGDFERALNSEPLEHVSLEIPDSITETFSAKNDKVTVKVDADPEKINVEAFAIKEYCQSEITSELVKKIADYFMEGQPLYERPKLLTKAELLNEIKKIEAVLDENRLDSAYGDSEETKQSIRSIEGMQYEKLKELYDNAPDTVEKKEATLEFRPYASFLNQAEYAADYAVAKYFAEKGDESAIRELEELEAADGKSQTSYKMWCEAIATLPDGFTGYVSAQNLSSSSIGSYAVGFKKGKAVGADQIPYTVHDTGFKTTPLTISEKDAMALTDKAVSELGFSDDYILTNIDRVDGSQGLQSFYRVVYYRNAISGLYMVDYFDLVSVDRSSKYRPEYGMESISFYVTDDGIVTFNMECPLKEVSSVNPSVQVKGFDEIYEIFKQHCAVSYDNIIAMAVDENDQIPDITYADETKVTFSEISLATLRIIKKGETTHYFIVPVWVFKGQLVHVQKLPGEDNPVNLGSATAVLINAIDGSIISADDCY